MRRRMDYRWIVTVIAFMCLFSYSAQAAEGPADQLKSTIDKVLDVLKDPNLQGDAKREERLQKLKAIIEPQFDFTEMAKQSLGAEWRKRTPAEQAEFVKLFTDLVEKTYANNIESYHGQKVIMGDATQDKSGYAEVNTRIVDSAGQENMVNYRLMSESGSWKVYDVVVEHVSIVNNYRAQFNRVIANSSYDELIRRLRRRDFGATKKS
jgi:phospholipid transport system substrate-binding protein